MLAVQDGEDVARAVEHPDHLHRDAVVAAEDQIVGEAGNRQRAHAREGRVLGRVAATRFGVGAQAGQRLPESGEERPRGGRVALGEVADDREHVPACPGALDETAGGHAPDRPPAAMISSASRDRASR